MPKLVSTLLSCALLAAGTHFAQAADPYSAALDTRFENGNSHLQASDPKVAALEEGIKAQAREMSVRPDVVAPAGPDEFSPWLMLAGIIGAAVVFGLAAIIILRRWNHWAEKEAAKREAALAEDPLMVEFIRALREELPLAPGEARAVATVPLDPAPTAPAIAELPASHESVGKNITVLRTEFQKLSRCTEEAARAQIFRDVLQQIELVKERSGEAQLRSVRLLASALHGLLNQLSLKSSNVTPSALRTAAAAIDLLETLCSRTSRADLATVPPVRLLAVDDDAISRRAVSMALKKAFNEPDLAPDGRSALDLATNQTYDLIFLDIEMPGMDGFELCEKIKETQQNPKTPVVFVTSHTDFDSRAKSALLGAHDLIGKPFLAFEITVKALTLVLRTREEQEAKQGSVKVKRAPVASELPSGAQPARDSSQRDEFSPAPAQTCLGSGRANFTQPA